MRINRATLERIINEEIVRYLENNLTEAPELGSPLDDMPPEGGEEDFGAGPPMEADADLQDSGDDPADDDLDAELAGDEPELPGSVAGDIQGKTIDSIEHVDESDSIPGAQEVVVGFQGEEDKLRIIITPSGDVKYFWKGLHSDIGTPEEIPPEDIEAEEGLEGEEDMDDLDTDSLALPTDDGGMEDPEIPEV